MSLLSGLIMATGFPLLFLGAIYKADFYQIGRYRFILLSLTGGVLAYFLAYTSNFLLGISSAVDPEISRLIVAPILEELLKGAALLCIVRLSRSTFSIDGALYGFATGIGFAIFENYEYMLANPAASLLIAIQRIFSANLVHASSSAILGIALGIFHLRRTRLRWLIFALGLILAIGQHILFNLVIEQAISPLLASGIGILGFLFVFFAMQRGKKQAQNWIKQKLGMGDRVTRGEVAIVDRLPNMDDILLPVVERFGPEMADKVERLLYLQARLGIKRKTLESFEKGELTYEAIEAEIQKMRANIDEARREIGVYAMLFVRGLYTWEMVSVWEQLQSEIQERSGLKGGQKGGGVWSSLEERLNFERLE